MTTNTNDGSGALASIPDPSYEERLMENLPHPAAGGKARRDAALKSLRDRRAALIRDFTAAALRVALERGEVTADDVRDLEIIPADIGPKFVGVVFRDLADSGILRRDGFRNSTRPAAHARPISVWRLADSAAATAWLASYRNY